MNKRGKNNVSGFVGGGYKMSKTKDSRSGMSGGGWVVGNVDEKKDRVVFFFTEKTAYEIGVRLVGSEVCIRDKC